MIIWWILAGWFFLSPVFAVIIGKTIALRDVMEATPQTVDSDSLA